MNKRRFLLLARIVGQSVLLKNKPRLNNPNASQESSIEIPIGYHAPMAYRLLASSFDSLLLLIRSSEVSKTMVLQRKANDIDMGLDEIELLDSIFEHRISQDGELLANRSRDF